MDFQISEEQAMLQDSVARFIDNDYDFESRQKHAESETGFSTGHWQQFAELGWTAVPFGEADGGLDGGPVELMLVMEQFGR
ncbi:MAG: acyl-CoA dehydrogenase family protein, partial [Pseudomonadota bacterium]